MQPVTFLAAVVFVAVTILNFTPGTDAVCCYPHVRMCGDCERATPYCGKGSCNMFGCNCDGGCRTGACTTKSNLRIDFEDLETPEAIIKTGDTDGDGRLSVEEARILMQNAINSDGPVEVEDLDTNGDGFLSIDEIN